MLFSIVLYLLVCSLLTRRMSRCCQQLYTHPHVQCHIAAVKSAWPPLLVANARCLMQAYISIAMDASEMGWKGGSMICTALYATLLASSGTVKTKNLQEL